MAVETITAGKTTAGRGSMAHSKKVCVPPPLAPVTPMRRIDVRQFASQSSAAQRIVDLHTHDRLQAATRPGG